MTGGVNPVAYAKELLAFREQNSFASFDNTGVSVATRFFRGLPIYKNFVGGFGLRCSVYYSL